ncbi:hypothetical protein IV203_017272 [Nitzschia inconspicua]|uniref:Uncharacterized protein n=1 Tax=Nitzschia inconspicua TaxID=303405 RepID=A0A9K3PI84_9STRA|nr:hypothetical protein IV203_017272 [Nitzschia inconspicua]
MKTHGTCAFKFECEAFGIAQCLNKCSLILLFASYLSWLDRAGRPVKPEPDGWITITQEDFSQYRITSDALFFMNNGAKSSPTTQPSNNRSVPDPVEHFKRGIK